MSPLRAVLFSLFWMRFAQKSNWKIFLENLTKNIFQVIFCRIFQLDFFAEQIVCHFTSPLVASPISPIGMSRPVS